MNKLTKIYIGEFPVVECKLGGITIDLGKHVFATIHLGDFPHNVKPGDKLPLFTEISHAVTDSINAQPNKPQV